MNEPMDIELSVVVLCYQSADEITPFFNQIKSEVELLRIPYELVLVANYDSKNDPTPAIVSQIKESHPNVKAISHRKEGGMGWDMRSGLHAASGKFIAVIDGDGQMPASDIPMVYDIIKTGRYDLVKTYRARRYDGYYRKILSNVYNLLFRALYFPSFPLRDINSKPKIFTRVAFQQMHLKSNDWFTDAEIMIESLRLKLRICEVSSAFYKNERRASFVKFRTIFEFIYNLFTYRIKS